MKIYQKRMKFTKKQPKSILTTMDVLLKMPPDDKNITIKTQPSISKRSRVNTLLLRTEIVGYRASYSLSLKLHF